MTDERVTDTHRRLGWPLAAGLTFLAAGSVLVLEIAAGRLLAPYVGVSLMTYTGIIGAILAGIALGAWLGGRAADEFGPERLLGPTFVAGGLAAMAAVPITSVVGGLGLGSGFVAIVALAAVAFVLPATILSAVGPMLVRATIIDVATSGSIVGRLSAVGTVGAITGTFLTGFVLLGAVPTRPLIVATGALLVLVGIGLTWRFERSVARVAALAVASGVVGALALLIPSPCDTETAYYCVAIEPSESDPDGRYLLLDGLTHTYVDLADPLDIQFGYIRRFADMSAGRFADAAAPLDVLHVGGGGFSFPRYVDAAHPGTRQTVLELDPGVLAVARSELGFEPSENIEVVVGDARESIATVPDDSVDLVFGDAFGGLSVPWHLTTSEFLSEIDRVLRPGGVYVMNLIDYPPLGFVRAETETARGIFDEVAIVAGEGIASGEAGGNVVLVASDAAIDAAAVGDRIDAWGESARTEIVAGDPAIDAFVGDARALVDDFAPVDQLLGR